jgi:hypothetical protein
MARGIEGNEISSQKKKTGTSSTSKQGPKQLGIAGFFQRKSDPATSSITPAKRSSDGDSKVNVKKATSSSPVPAPTHTPALSNGVPASSSPFTAPRASQHSSMDDGRDKENGLWDHWA